MKRILAKEITAENFISFGACFDLLRDSPWVKTDQGAGFHGGYTKNPLIDRSGSLGITETEDPLPFRVGEMERHLHTQEAMMCMDKPIVFLAAPQTEEDRPDGDQAEAFVLMPGQAAVINRGVWHSPAHGIDGPVMYYWMAEAYDGEPTLWAEIKGGPVEVDV